MTRNRKSAKNAGSQFNQMIADGLARELGNPDIDRTPPKGNRDLGDVANVRHANGQRIAIETKDYAGREWSPQPGHVKRPWRPGTMAPSAALSWRSVGARRTSARSGA